jgi:hypothetical protein
MTDEGSFLSGAAGDEATRIHDVVRENAVPEGFRTFDLEFGEDATGDPAVWIWLAIDPKYPTEKENIQALSRVRRRVKSALLRARIGRIPYVRFREKSAGAA